MLESIARIKQYAGWMDFYAFESDDKTLDACLMQFQHLWETANKLKTAFPDENHISYVQVVGFRNFIAHEYLGIDIGIVFDTIQNDLPGLEKLIQKRLKELSNG